MILYFSQVGREFPSQRSIDESGNQGLEEEED